MESNRVNEWSARLKAFGMIVKLGHDVFNAPDFNVAGGIAVNSSRALLKYKSSALLELSGGKARIVAQYAQLNVNPHSDVAHQQVTLCEHLEFEPNPRVLKLADIGSLDDETGGALSQLLEGNGQLMAVRLEPPAFLGKVDFRLIWLIEFPDEIPGYAANAVGILMHNYANALYCHRCCRVPTQVRLRRHFSPKRTALYFVLLVIAALMFFPVQDTVNTEFTLKAPETVSTYAWFDGPIAKCYRQDGDLVKAGEVIAEYDTSQLEFRLANAESEVGEIEKECELETAAAFSDRERLGKVQLIEARLEGARVAVEEARWYLEHSKLTAPIDGVLALADGRAEQLVNKAVRTGDRIFDVYGGRGVVAEIRVDERDSSILLNSPEATLFLYTQPDRALEAQITDIRQYPELTEQRTYCYKVRATLKDEIEARYGMRGIAKLRGGRVSLGYYLFKNLVIYLRWI